MPQFKHRGPNFITISVHNRGFCKADYKCIAESFLRFLHTLESVFIVPQGKTRQQSLFTIILHTPAFWFYLDNLESISRFEREGYGNSGLFLRGRRAAKNPLQHWNIWCIGLIQKTPWESRWRHSIRESMAMPSTYWKAPSLAIWVRMG